MYVFALVFGATSIVVVLEALLGSEAKNIGTLVAAASILAATSGWILTNALSLTARIRDRTFSYLGRVTSEQLLYAKCTDLGKAWKSAEIQKILDNPSDVASYFINEYHTSKIIPLLRDIGNILEEIAVSIKYGIVDEGILKSTFKEIVAIHISRLQPFLPAFRNSPQMPGHPYGNHSADDVFTELIKLGCRWTRTA